MRKELSDAFLRSLKAPPEGRREVRDAKVPGLVFRLTSSNAATWSLRTRTQDGKQTRPTLGTWPAMSITEARKAALTTLSAIQAGADPVAEQRRQRAARNTPEVVANSVEARIQEWQASRATDPVKGWSPRYTAEVKRVVAREIVPALGARNLADTTRAEWTGLISAKRKSTPAMASSLYRIVSSFLGYAEANGWVATPLLPRKGVATLAPPAKARERVLTDEELRAVWRASGREVPRLRCFVRLLILTAARELEVADIAAGEVDRANGRWNIPSSRTKNRSAYAIPLGSLAVAELSMIWPNDEPAATMRLLGRSGGSGFRGFSRLKARLDIASGVEGWRFHDLRRSARTGMTKIGVQRDHAEAAINHISGRSSLERTYDRHDYAHEIIGALNAWQTHVADLLSQPLPTAMSA